MPLFRKSEVKVLEQGNSYDQQLEELRTLYDRAGAELKEKIAQRIQYLEYGKQGENELLFQLKYIDMDMVVLHDLYLESDDLSAQIDYYIITPKANFIIECKNLFGNVTINEKGDFIRSYTYGNQTVKEGFPSPITQNERHLLVLRNAKRDAFEKQGKFAKLIGAIGDKIDARFTKSLVVLSNSRTLINDKYAPREIKAQVLRSDALGATIKNLCAQIKQAGLNMKEMQSEGAFILSLCKENPKDYNASLREQVEAQETAKKAAAQKWTCPRCGKHLVRRKGKNGPFIGCTGYPACTYTRNIYIKRGE